MRDRDDTTSDTAACAACGGATRELGWRGDYLYVRCGACGTAQLSPVPTPEELAHAYAHDYVTSGHYGDSPEEMARSCAPLYEAAEAASDVEHAPLRKGR